MSDSNQPPKRSAPNTNGAARSAPNSSGAARSAPNTSGVARSAPNSSGTARSAPNTSGAARSAPNTSGAARSAPNASGAARSAPNASARFAPFRGNNEVGSISRKEFKPTIPIRRKKVIEAEPVFKKSERVPHEKVKFQPKKGNLQQKLHDRKRKEVVRASGGLFGFTGGTDGKLANVPLVTNRSAAELEEEKYIDPFQQSTNELTPLSLPINPRLDCKSSLSVGRRESKSKDLTEQSDEATISEMLYRDINDSSESTYLFTLPDALPVTMSKLSLDKETTSATATTAASNINADDTPKEPKTATIQNLPEGYFGRLQILRSGKARIMVGEIPLEVQLVGKTGYLQEIVCAQTQSLDVGLIGSIGTIPYSFSVTPQYDSLIT